LTIRYAQVIIVQWSGTDVANGQYAMVGFYNSVPTYRNDNDVELSLEEIGDSWGWVIGDGKGKAFYMCQVSGPSTHEPPNDGWHKGPQGKAPLPSVSRETFAGGAKGHLPSHSLPNLKLHEGVTSFWITFFF
jgi:hypothetical protein